MLVLIWTLAVIIAIGAGFYKAMTRLQRRGIKSDSIWASMKVFLKWEHRSYIIRNTYDRFPDERFAVSYAAGVPVLQIHDLDLIKKITVKDFEHFADHRDIAPDDPLFSRNLFSLKGDEWKDMRSNLSPAFTSSKMKLMLPFMVEVAEQMILKLKKTIKEKNSVYAEVNGKDLMTRSASDVIASCAFGVKVNSHTENDNEFYVRGIEAINFKIPTLMGMIIRTVPWLRKTTSKRMFFTENTVNFFTDLVLSSIKNREENNIVRSDMIHLLIEAKKGKLVHDEKSKDPDTGFATVDESEVVKRKVHKEWSDRDLVAQAVLFIVAGFDTVSTALSFMLYELAVNPDVQDKLYEEIEEVGKKNGGKLDFNTIQEMTYLDMVVSEVLRKWPPAVSLDRICVKDYNLGRPNPSVDEDYIVRRGEVVQIPVSGMHRDPKYYPNPNKFDPERFSEENRNNIKPFTYSPFGLGPRNCIGSRFALCEVKVMAYHIIKHLEVSPGPRTTITNDLEPTTLNVSIKGGHWVQFKVRN